MAARPDPTGPPDRRRSKDGTAWRARAPLLRPHPDPGPAQQRAEGEGRRHVGGTKHAARPCPRCHLVARPDGRQRGAGRDAGGDGGDPGHRLGAQRGRAGSDDPDRPLRRGSALERRRKADRRSGGDRDRSHRPIAHQDLPGQPERAAPADPLCGPLEHVPLPAARAGLDTGTPGGPAAAGGDSTEQAERRRLARPRGTPDLRRGVAGSQGGSQLGSGRSRAGSLGIAAARLCRWLSGRLRP